MSDKIQSKSKDVDTSIFHSRSIRMLVSKKLGKKDISWEHFVVASHFKLDVESTPQSQNARLISSTNAAKAGTNKKINGRVHVNVSKLIKKVP